jgi:hypothetical protein
MDRQMEVAQEMKSEKERLVAKLIEKDEMLVKHEIALQELRRQFELVEQAASKRNQLVDSVEQRSEDRVAQRNTVLQDIATLVDPTLLSSLEKAFL